MVAGSLASFLAGPFAGAIVDKYDRKYLLIFTDFVRAALVLVLLLFVSEDYYFLPGIYLVVAALAVAASFAQPALMAIIPSVAEKQQIGKANSVLIGTSQALWALGFAIGGLLSLRLSFTSFVWFNAASFVLSGLIIMKVKIRPSDEASKKKELGLLQSVRQGFRDLRDHDLARSLVVMELLEHIPHGAWTSAVMLAFVERNLNGDADDWGYIAAIYFGSMAVGALLATAMSKSIDRHPGKIIIVNAFLTCLLTAAFGLSTTVFVAILVSIVFGVPNSMRDVAQDTLLQSKVKQDLLGRVYATRNMFSHLLFMIAGVVYAWMADFTDVSYIYLISAAIYFLTGLYALSSKSLRESRI